MEVQSLLQTAVRSRPVLKMTTNRWSALGYGRQPDRKEKKNRRVVSAAFSFVPHFPPRLWLSNCTMPLRTSKWSHLPTNWSLRQTQPTLRRSASTRSSKAKAWVPSSWHGRTARAPPPSKSNAQPHIRCARTRKASIIPAPVWDSVRIH